MSIPFPLYLAVVTDGRSIQCLVDSDLQCNVDGFSQSLSLIGSKRSSGMQPDQKLAFDDTESGSQLLSNSHRNSEDTRTEMQQGKDRLAKKDGREFVNAAKEQ